MSRRRTAVNRINHLHRRINERVECWWPLQLLPPLQQPLPFPLTSTTVAPAAASSAAAAASVLERHSPVTRRLGAPRWGDTIASVAATAAATADAAAVTSSSAYAVLNDCVLGGPLDVLSQAVRLIEPVSSPIRRPFARPHTRRTLTAPTYRPLGAIRRSLSAIRRPLTRAAHSQSH